MSLQTSWDSFAAKISPATTWARTHIVTVGVIVLVIIALANWYFAK